MDLAYSEVAVGGGWRRGTRRGREREGKGREKKGGGGGVVEGREAASKPTGAVVLVVMVGR